MRDAILLVTGIIAFVAAAFVPGGAMDGAKQTFERAKSQRDVAEVAAAPASKGTDTAPNYALGSGGQTELRRAADGHFYADARVNGRSVRFLVDTGASAIALTGRDARSLGLFWSDLDIRAIGKGASGPVYGVPVRLDRLEIDGHEARNLDAFIIPSGLEISLLGQSFLGALDSVSIENDTMVLGR